VLTVISARRHVRARRLVVAMIAASFVTTAVSCESDSELLSDSQLVAAQPTQTAPLGSTLEIPYETDWRYGTPSKGTAAFTVADLQPRDVPIHRFTGDGSFVTVAVTVRVLSGTVRVNPYFFSARTQDGVNVLTDMATLQDGVLQGQHYQQGSLVTGLLGFDVPKGTVIEEIALNAGNLGRALGRWTVP